MPPVLRSPGLRLQAEPSGGAARDQDHRERSAVNVVAGRAMTSLPELIPDVDFLLAMEAEELAGTMPSTSGCSFGKLLLIPVFGKHGRPPLRQSQRQTDNSCRHGGLELAR